MLKHTEKKKMYFELLYVHHLDSRIIFILLYLF